jgi:hypothetical protein
MQRREDIKDIRCRSWVGTIHVKIILSAQSIVGGRYSSGDEPPSIYIQFPRYTGSSSNHWGVPHPTKVVLI